MKRYFLVLCLVLAMVLAGCSNQSSNGPTDENDGTENNEPIRLTASSYTPPKHAYTLGFHDHFLDRVEEATQGKVKFDRYYGAELVPWAGEITALEAGTTDLTLSSLRSYHPDLFPMADIATLPVMGGNAIIFTKAWIDLLESDVELKDGKTYYELEISDHGFHALPLPAMDNYVISAAKKELKNPRDFKGLILRAGFRPHEIFIKNLGSTPVTMPAGELYDALSRGTIDGMPFGVADWPSYGFGDILKYTIQGLELGTYTGENLMTIEKWESLPQDVRDAMTKIAHDQALKGAQYFLDILGPTIEEAKANGAVFVQFKDLPAETQELLNNAVAKTWRDWIDKVTEEGAPGLECARLWRDLVVKHGASVPEEVMNL
ncbi:MAG: TRAP transporter substrate-binding protein [Syntrophomonadaceae bacterium]|jgi:TRAP-type C4-dicarboxylate transport system substrate-binding protein